MRPLAACVFALELGALPSNVARAQMRQKEVRYNWKEMQDEVPCLRWRYQGSSRALTACVR